MRIRRHLHLIAWFALALPLIAADPPVEKDAPGTLSAEIAQLKAMLAEQQLQINELRDALAGKKTTEASVAPPAAPLVVARPNLGEVASTTPIIPLGPAAVPATTLVFVPSPVPQAPQLPLTSPTAPPPDPIQRAIDSINGNLRGFRISGDFRLRTDVLVREKNTDFPTTDNRSTPQQRARERYRVRLNLDKDLFFKDGADRSLASFHLQLATDPFNNPSTQDTDFAGISTRAPISINEAYMDFRPTKSLTLRVGRTAEIFADNRQFVYDDDIRFNGFHETYRWNSKKAGFFVQLAAAQYILTDPNIQVLPTGSPFTAAGYAVGQRIPSSNLLDQGIMIGSNIGKKWTHNETVNYFVMREPNQIQLASTAGGAPLFATSPIVGANLISNLGETGNGTTTAGGATYTASHFHVIRGAFNLNYSGKMLMGHNYPFQLFLQTTHNTGASFDNNGYMLGASLGQAARLGDIQFQYQYFYKPGNAFISQFSDDDVGTGAGVNVKTTQLRVNFGLTRFLSWENRLYIQKGISVNGPNYFLPLQQGYNTQFRVHSQFVFTF